MQDEIKTTKPFSGPEFTPTTPSKKPSAIIIKVIISLIVLGVLGGTGSLFARVWDPLWNPFRLSPEEVIKRMRSEMTEIKSQHSEIKLNFTAEQPGKEKLKFLITADGNLDVKDPDNQKSQARFNITGEVPQQGRFSLGVEVKSVAETFYVKLNIPPYLKPYLMMGGIDADKIKDQWIKVEKESLVNLPTPYSPIQPQKAETKQKEISMKIRELLQNKSLYYIQKEFSDQKIRGREAYHYVLVLDNERLKEIIPELFRISMESQDQSTQGLATAFIMGGMTEMFNNLVDKMGEIKTDIWIGKKDYLIYRIKTEKEVDLTELFEGKLNAKINLAIEINWSDFGRELELELPEESILLKDIMPQKKPNQGQVPSIPQ